MMAAGTQIGHAVYKARSGNSSDSSNSNDSSGSAAAANGAGCGSSKKARGKYFCKMLWRSIRFRI